MKRTLVILAAFSAATALAPWAHAQAATAKKPRRAPASAGAAVEDQIMKMEKDRAQAVVRADVAAIAAETADDYTLINANGQLSGKAETMDAIKTGSIKLTSNELSDLKVRVYGNAAIVTGRSDAKGTIGGREVKGPILFTRVYVKKNGRWQSVAFQQTPIASP
jgi:ketosteroid isomerase-like protein